MANAKRMFWFSLHSHGQIIMNHTENVTDKLNKSNRGRKESVWNYQGLEKECRAIKWNNWLLVRDVIEMKSFGGVNTWLDPLIFDRSWMSNGAGLCKRPITAQHKRKMKKMEASKLLCITYTTNILPRFLDGCKSVLSAFGSLFTEKLKPIITQYLEEPLSCIGYCLHWIPQYLTKDSRSTSSLRIKGSECGPAWAFFLLSTPANQSSLSSALFWLLGTSGMAGLVRLPDGAEVSAVVFAAGVAWLPVREGFLSSTGEEGVFGDSVEGLGCLASSSRKARFVLRPNQSAEFRGRVEVGVVCVAGVIGFDFFSGIEALTSSVENLFKRKMVPIKAIFHYVVWHFWKIN